MFRITTCRTKYLDYKPRRLIFAQEGILALTMKLAREHGSAKLADSFFPHPYLYLQRHGYMIFPYVYTSTS